MRTDFLFIYVHYPHRSCPFLLFSEPLKLKNIMRVLNGQDFYEVCHEI